MATTHEQAVATGKRRSSRPSPEPSAKEYPVHAACKALKTPQERCAFRVEHRPELDAELAKMSAASEASDIAQAEAAEAARKRAVAGIGPVHEKLMSLPTAKERIAFRAKHATSLRAEGAAAEGGAS